VEEGDTRTTEDRYPLVALGLVVGKAADLSVRLLLCDFLLVESGNREHVRAPLLKSHYKLLHRHLHHHA
jgi:hypothetical protein